MWSVSVVLWYSLNAGHLNDIYIMPTGILNSVIQSKTVM